MNLPKEIILLDGENVIDMLEGNAVTDSPNPLVKLISFIIGIFALLMGVRLKTVIVLTDKRLIRMNRTKIFWFITRDIDVVTFSKKQLGSFGYYQARRWLFFKTLYFSFWENFYMARITYKGKLADLNSFIAKLTEYIHGND